MNRRDTAAQTFPRSTDQYVSRDSSLSEICRSMLLSGQTFWTIIKLIHFSFCRDVLAGVRMQVTKSLARLRLLFTSMNLWQYEMLPETWVAHLSALFTGSSWRSSPQITNPIKAGNLCKNYDSSSVPPLAQSSSGSTFITITSATWSLGGLGRSPVIFLLLFLWFIGLICAETGQRLPPLHAESKINCCSIMRPHFPWWQKTYTLVQLCLILDKKNYLNSHTMRTHCHSLHCGGWYCDFFRGKGFLSGFRSRAWAFGQLQLTGERSEPPYLPAVLGGSVPASSAVPHHTTNTNSVTWHFCSEFEE